MAVRNVRLSLSLSLFLCTYKNIIEFNLFFRSSASQTPSRYSRFRRFVFFLVCLRFRRLLHFQFNGPRLKWQINDSSLIVFKIFIKKICSRKKKGLEKLTVDDIFSLFLSKLCSTRICDFHCSDVVNCSRRLNQWFSNLTYQGVEIRRMDRRQMLLTRFKCTHNNHQNRTRTHPSICTIFAIAFLLLTICFGSDRTWH